MFITPRIICSVSFAVALFTGSVWAASSSIEGTVKDANGKVLSNADIKIEAKGGGSPAKMVKTNASGHYAYNGLTAGETYQVSLIVNGAMKASINNVKTKVGPTQLNFDLQKGTDPKAAAATGKKKTHKVWVKSGTGSSLGGRWIEVEDGGTIAPDVGRVNTVKGSDIRR
jgi:hypothetical protein